MVTDITGKTGMEIIRAIVAGQHDPEELVKFRDCRCKNPLDVMIAALTGNNRPENLFTLKQSLALIDFYASQLIECDEAIALKMKQLQQQTEPPEKPLPKKSKVRGAIQ